MNKPLTQTVRLLRPARVTTDDRGRTVWDGPVEEAELELVSTTMLRSMLASDDAERQSALRAAATGKDGVLAKNLASGSFEIIAEDDLRAALEAADTTPAAPRAADVTLESLAWPGSDPAQELSLVSTQALRKMLGQAEKSLPDDEPRAGRAKTKMPGGGFDPYNSG